ncbi:S1C family serine protease [Tepidibacter formicigenes]|jgi:2-alkenal reductase|uniref:2-alkenal reductase n=1 Tax=Tepidibacter formicigenes DSM 15518 TaxID=1123349 RepID=A0A1M6JST0_9FIRM|nr:trypsin-like peptidase domain-containing protein [Tepidibacter formicigenes]SHJ49733.1 2-alkenal reductase [Tepidibacter formicigenes DSM 15518]
MRKILSFILGITMLFSMTTPVFAAEDKQENLEKLVKQVQELQQELEKEKKKVSQVIDEVNQSVVAIIGENKKYRERDYIYSKFPKNLQHGSGVIINNEGRIITNNHVVDGLDEIYVVTYDGNVYKAELLYSDKEMDLGLLKINRTDLKPIKLANENEIKVGDEVIAIGTPLSFGYRNSASKGIISGLNRPVDRSYTYLQTDASINPGNSGGPLVNMNGELVGINTLGSMFFEGMNFSIPVGNINYFLDHYNKFGKIRRCFTGIEFEENWAAMLGIPSNQGLKVVTIRKDAVVNFNQVKEGDILEAIDGKSITSIAQYNEVLKNYLPGDKVKLTFSRGNEKIDITVILKEQPEKEILK